MSGGYVTTITYGCLLCPAAASAGGVGALGEGAGFTTQTARDVMQHLGDAHKITGEQISALKGRLVMHGDGQGFHLNVFEFSDPSGKRTLVKHTRSEKPKAKKGGRR